jgi:hypothetical protein
MSRAESFGEASFLCIVMLTQMVYTFALVPFFSEPLRQIKRAAWPWLIAAASLMALQALILNSAIAHYRHATAFNVIYSSRGLWSIVLLGFFGQWIRNQELSGSRALLIRRVVGASLLMVAVALVLADS